MQNKTINFLPYLALGYDSTLNIDEINNKYKNSPQNIEYFIQNQYVGNVFFPPSSVKLVLIDINQNTNSIANVITNHKTVRNINLLEIGSSNFFTQTVITDDLYPAIINENYHFGIHVTYEITKNELPPNVTSFVNMTKLSSFSNIIVTPENATKIDIEQGNYNEIPLMIDFKSDKIVTSLTDNSYIHVSYLLDF
jgi:hypothetical protein